MQTTKIAVTGDTHVDSSSRFDEHQSIMSWIARDAVERGCSLMLHSGDIFERRSNSIEREAVDDWCRMVAENMPLIVVAGNHDDPRDVEALDKLAARHPIIGVSKPDVVSLPGLPFAVACLPWPRKGHLLATCVDQSLGDTDDLAREGLRAILRQLGAQTEGVRSLFVGHCMMRGSKTSESQPPLVGADMELSLDDLALVGARMYALGHIHLEQSWSIGDAPVFYPGAPRHCNWGELERKGYSVATLVGDRVVDVEFVSTPCTPMVALDARWDSGSLLYETDGQSLVGAEVRLRYTVRSDEREPARRAAIEARETFLAAGALAVKVEERVVVHTRARVPEVMAATTVLDRLHAYWDQQVKPPTAERRDQLATLLGQIEGAV